MPVRRKHCVVCQQPIPPHTTGRPRLTCSDACRQSLRRLRRSGFDPADPDQRIAAWEREFGPLTRVYKRWPTPLRERFRIWLVQGHAVPTCRRCRRPYVNRAHEPFCSIKCRRAHRAERDRLQSILTARRASLDPAIIQHFKQRQPIALCAHCGDPMLPTSPYRRYCSDTCRHAAWRKKGARCPVCGTRFDRRQVGRTVKTYCSKRCRQQHWQQNKRADHRAALLYPRPCPHCGTIFTPAGRNPSHQIYCSRNCVQRAFRRRQKNAA